MKWRAGAYLRLSKENRYGYKEVSDSVENQRKVIEQYISSHSDIEVQEFYIDDGATGLDYDRAGFEQMLTDIEAGRINTIITKDLSRLGREQIQTLQLVTLSFVEQHIRYIAINDGYDSYIDSDTTMIEIKAFFNNFYSADNSKKVRAVQKAKREAGEFIGSFAPYGYKKDPENNNKLVPDEEAAAVVRRIYDLYLSGMGLKRIARTLSDDGILAPTAYKQLKQGMTYKNALKYETTQYWTYSTISRILQHRVYAGDMVQHTQEKISYRSKKTRAVPKEERCIVENTHEPIIERSKFDIVQNLMKTKHRDMKNAVGENISMYAGLFFCGDCGRRMCKFYTAPRKDGIKDIVYKCGTYSQFGKNRCSIHYIKNKELEEIILAAIRENAVKALQDDSYENIQRIALDEKKADYKSKLEKNQLTMEQIRARHERMLMNLSDGIISKDEFVTFNERNKEELQEVAGRIEELRERLQDESIVVDQYTLWVENFVKYRDITELKREILVNLVERIEIYEDKHLEITFRFRNPFE